MAVYREETRIPVDAITSDGQTVVDLYYDRNVHNLYFQISVQEYVYTIASGTNGIQYGFYNGEYIRIYYNRRNRQWYRDNSYNNPYTGNRYTRSSRQSWQTIKTITELYQHNIAAEFPIQGDNGVTYNNGERWEPQNSSTFSQVLVRIENTLRNGTYVPRSVKVYDADGVTVIDTFTEKLS